MVFETLFDTVASMMYRFLRQFGTVIVFGCVGLPLAAQSETRWILPSAITPTVTAPAEVPIARKTTPSTAVVRDASGRERFRASKRPELELFEAGALAISGFGGYRLRAPFVREGAPEPDRDDPRFRFLDPQGAAVSLFSVAALDAAPGAQVIDRSAYDQILARDVGQVFGLAIYNSEFRNLYLTASSAKSDDGWTCFRSDGLGTSCLNPSLFLAPEETQTIAITLTLPGQEAGRRFENCAALGVGTRVTQRAFAIQAAMQARGIEGGLVDGAPVRKTRAAVRDLQRTLGLEPTGEIDDTLFAALGIPAAGTGEAACATVDLPPMKISCPAGQKRNSKGQCYTPRPQCNAATTVLRGNECVCRCATMRQVNSTRCACTNGLPPVPGAGCVKVERPRGGDGAVPGGGRTCVTIAGCPGVQLMHPGLFCAIKRKPVS